MRKLLKTVGFVLGMLALLIVMLIGVLAEFVPAAIPDWMYLAGQILSIPFVIIFLVHLLKAWKKQRNTSKKN